MNTRPPGVSDGLVADALAVGWAFEAAEIEYAAVGFGSHHWIAVDGRGDRRFVTVDDLTLARMGPDAEAAFARLDAAFTATRQLADAGLDFVVPPLVAVDGPVLHRLAPAFSIAVFPWVEGASPGERDAVVGVLERLHAVDPAVAPSARVDDHVLPCRVELEQALAEVDRPWTGGPFSEPVRSALVSSADVVGALARYDALAAAVRSADRPRVLTHGEPHPANVLWTERGPRLVDWDTVLLAPPERDRWMVDGVGDPDALALYALWWDLEEIGGGVAQLRGPHGDTADTRTTLHAVEVAVRNLTP